MLPVVYCVFVFQMAASTEGKQREDEWTDYCVCVLLYAAAV